MTRRSLKILQVNSVDRIGGAARIAWMLHQAYQLRGYEAWMVVDRKFSDDSRVYELPTLAPPSKYGQFFYHLAKQTAQISAQIGTLSIADIFRRLAEPVRYWNRYWGKDDFEHRGTSQLLNLAKKQPDIVHLHNLHGHYFDLRYLAELSSFIPTLITLHDTWLLSGHCAYFLDCERWKIGCGNCPYLEIYPSVNHDATAYNWNVKKDIYDRSRLHIATPSQWLLDQVAQSMLAPSIRRAKVIRNGVDLSVFYPTDRSIVRSNLKIPVDAQVLLFVAGGLQNVFKDFKTIQETIHRIAHLSEKRILLLALGGDGSLQNIGNIEIRSIPYVNDPNTVADYYRVADVYVHATRADTFPNVVLEALACGTPVVATAVGGIPEQIADGETGFLTPPGDADAMAAAVSRLLAETNLHSKMRSNAANHAKKNFGLDRMINNYLDFYVEILDDWQSL